MITDDHLFNLHYAAGREVADKVEGDVRPGMAGFKAIRSRLKWAVEKSFREINRRPEFAFEQNAEGRGRLACMLGATIRLKEVASALKKGEAV